MAAALAAGAGAAAALARRWTGARPAGRLVPGVASGGAAFRDAGPAAALRALPVLFALALAGAWLPVALPGLPGRAVLVSAVALPGLAVLVSAEASLAVALPGLAPLVSAGASLAAALPGPAVPVSAGACGAAAPSCACCWPSRRARDEAVFAADVPRRLVFLLFERGIA